MSTIELTGLDGRNPLAYFAALGCLASVSRVRPDAEARLGWRPGATPRPFLDVADLTPDDITVALDADRQAWENAPAINFRGYPDVKLSAAEQRAYLTACRDVNDGRSDGLGAALVAEGAFAKTGDGKPTDLHFSAGQQKFLVIARDLQERVTTKDLGEALFGPWSYTRLLPTFGWDMTDDRVYAYGYDNPSTAKKFTVPGADWLALTGLAAYPVRANGDQASPPGASGNWKFGSFRWGLWHPPLSWAASKYLVGTGFDPASMGLMRAGVFQVMQSRIRRSDQGGYGSFSPSSVVWSDSLPGLEGASPC